MSKIFYDLTSATVAQWFFYYDPFDRLTEVRYTPNVSDASTYSVFQLFWLKDRLVLYWQTDYPSVTTSRRYVGTDETGRPIDMICWSTGNCPRVWSINPSAWGYDTNVVGPTVYQPILFAGQYQDPESAAWEDDMIHVHRPGVALSRYRTYDPFTGGFVQYDPAATDSHNSYVYAGSNPVGRLDPFGLMEDEDRTVSCHEACANIPDDGCTTSCKAAGGDNGWCHDQPGDCGFNNNDGGDGGDGGNGGDGGSGGASGTPGDGITNNGPDTGYLPADQFGLGDFEGLGEQDPSNGSGGCWTGVWYRPRPCGTPNDYGEECGGTPLHPVAPCPPLSNHTDDPRPSCQQCRAACHHYIQRCPPNRNGGGRWGPGCGLIDVGGGDLTPQECEAKCQKGVNCVGGP